MGFDELWQRVARVVSFGLGTWILYHEAFQETFQRPYLYAVAVALIGPQAVGVIERILKVAEQVIAAVRAIPPEERSPPLDKGTGK